MARELSIDQNIIENYFKDSPINLTSGYDSEDVSNNKNNKSIGDISKRRSRLSLPQKSKSRVSLIISKSLLEAENESDTYSKKSTVRNFS